MRISLDLIIPTGPQVAAARKLLRWTQHDLALKAGVAIGTIRNLEEGTKGASTHTIIAVVEALEAAGVKFTNGEEPGVKRSKP